MTSPSPGGVILLRPAPARLQAVANGKKKPGREGPGNPGDREEETRGKDRDVSRFNVRHCRRRARPAL